MEIELPPDLGSGRGEMGFGVVLVGELPGQEGPRRAGGQLFGQADAAQEAAFLGADQADVRAQAADQVDPLRAHPVGHEDGHGMAKGPADRGKGDSGVSAGGLDDQAAGGQGPALVGLAQDVEGHAVLDAARHVQVFGFGVKDPPLSAEGEFDLHERRVADQAGQLGDLLFLIGRGLRHR